MAQRQHSAGNDVTLDMPSTSSSQQESAGQVSCGPSRKTDNFVYITYACWEVPPLKCNRYCLLGCSF